MCHQGWQGAHLPLATPAVSGCNLSDPFPASTFLSSTMLELGDYIAPVIWDLALQLPFLQVSESMGNHDSKIVDAYGVD
jgi:hypothetical protein